MTAEVPFFVVGAQRSGTTMLRLMLNAHPRLCVPFESGFVAEMASRLPEFGNLSSPANVARLLEAIGTHPFVVKGRLLSDPISVMARLPRSYPEVVDAIFAEHARQRGKARWGDKTPTYVLEMGTLRRLFPRCRFIHIVRDGRDVALSLAQLSWGSRDLVRVAQDWRWKVTMGRRAGEMIEADYLEILYEDLVTAPGPTLRRICGFLGERFDPAMLEYPRDAEAEMPEQSLSWHRHSVQAPDARMAGQWRGRMSQVDQAVFEQVAGEALDLFGYERRQPARTLASRLRFAQYALLGHA